jgi:HAD superfamily hydrolase (TIGR01509 family)
MAMTILFDVDGTLVDSNDAHARTWVSALLEAGYDVPFDRIRPLIGMGGDRLLPRVTGGLAADSEMGENIGRRRLEIFLTRELPAVSVMSGARQLLEAVRARGGRVVVATGAKRAELEKILAVGDLGPLVDLSTTSDDASKTKPAPDVVNAALAQAGVAARDAVMVGDTVYDVQAAHSAGVACVALRCGGSDSTALRDAEAVYRDPLELTAALDRAPFAWLQAPTAPAHH